MKYCPFCGYSVENIYTFCPKCGKNIPDVSIKDLQTSDVKDIPEPDDTQYYPAWKDAPADLLSETDGYQHYPAWKDAPEVSSAEVRSRYPARDNTPAVSTTEAGSYPQYSVRRDAQEGRARTAEKNDADDFLKEINSLHPAWKSDAEAFLQEISANKSAAQTRRDIRGNSFHESIVKAGEIPEKRMEDSERSGQKTTENIRRKTESVKYSEPPAVQNTEKTVVTVIEDHSGGIGWWLLGFFLPVVGLFIYLNEKNKKPGRAHSSASGALTILILFTIVAVVFLFGVIKGYISLV